MKKINYKLSLACLLFSCVCYSANAQDSNEGIDIQELKERKVVVEQMPDYDEKPFVTVEQMPQFNGGNQAMMEFIKNNIKYPEIAKENGVEGRVVLRFVVDRIGKIRDIQVIRSLEKSCDAEAIKLVKSMPDWIPGKQNGREVRVYFTLPVTFRLGEDLNRDTVFTNEQVDKKAEFDGNLDAYFRENYKELNLPTEGGTLTVNFIIEPDGSISNIRTVKSVSPEYDSSAVKFIKSMPKWKPALKSGIAVRNKQHINFRIKYEKP